MIEVCFADTKEQQCVRERILHWINQKRGVCREYERVYPDGEVAVMELACTYEQGGKLGTAWFEKCLQKIRMQYPKQLIYFSEDICRKYAMPEYQKKWICWYSLFPELWEKMVVNYQIEEQNLDVLFVDMEGKLDFSICRVLAKKVRHIEIVTKRKKAWRKLYDEVEDAYGLVLEIKEKIPDDIEGKVIVDVLGTQLRQYAHLVEKNYIFAVAMTDRQKEYMQNRVKNKKVVCGFVQSIYGEKAENRFASIFMQSRNWKLRQLANDSIAWEEECGDFEWEEMKEIRERYQWKVEQLEIR